MAIVRRSEPEDYDEGRFDIDPANAARLEARNGLIQYDWAMDFARRAIERGTFYLDPSTILMLNEIAVKDVRKDGGRFRSFGVVIGNSNHKPPPHAEVPELTDELCSYINKNWGKTALHLSAYLLWRLNWVHPFSDGNGRSSRMLSYMVLCIRMKQLLPGTTTVPEQISNNKTPYYLGLDAADDAHAEGKIDVSVLEELLDGLLAGQLLGILDSAKRESKPDAD